ncbi:MAG: hypothetical protein CFE44_01435, partial [Burkholderiales bacterium PBB4]
YGGTSQGAVNTGSYSIVPGGLTSGNYSINYGAGTLAISPVTVTVTGLAANNKEFDGTTSVDIRDWGKVNTGVASETLTLNHGTASFADAAVGINKAVVATGYSLADGTNGGRAANYVLSSTSAATIATIEPFKQPAAVSSATGALTVSWRIGNQTGTLDVSQLEPAAELWVVENPAAAVASAPTDTPAANPPAPTGVARPTSGQPPLANSPIGAVAGASLGGNQTNASGTTGSSNASPAPTPLSAPGFVGVMNPRVTPQAKPQNFVDQPVVLTGVERAAIVGATGTGAAVVASVAAKGNPVRLAVTVAPGESFEVSLPPALLGVSNPGAVTLESGLPPWMAFDRSTLKFSAGRVPPGASPAVVKLRGASGKSVEVTFQ